jgi:hypothetical protein
MVALCVGVVAVSLTGCTSWTGEGRGGGESTVEAESDGRDPTAADLDELRAAIKAMPNVTGVELNYDPETFESGSPVWSGSATMDTNDHAVQVKTWETVLTLLWTRAELRSGVYEYFVEGPDGSTAGGSDVGYSASLHSADMEELFGPRPTPTATATAIPTT